MIRIELSEELAEHIVGLITELREVTEKRSVHKNCTQLIESFRFHINRLKKIEEIRREIRRLSVGKSWLEIIEAEKKT